MDDKFFEFLVATDQLDDFLGLKEKENDEDDDEGEDFDDFDEVEDE